MISEPKLEALVAAMAKAPTADNLQPICFSWDGSRLAVLYDKERASGKTFGPDAPATLLAVGAALENLVQAARYLGVTISDAWLDGLDLDAGRYAVVDMSRAVDSEVEPCIDDLPLSRRHTNRFAFEPDPVPEAILQSVTESREGNAFAQVFSTRAEVQSISRLVGIASTVRFRTREIHEWLGASLRFGKSQVASGTGLDVDTLDLPPGGRLFMALIRQWRFMRLLNMMGAYKAMAAIERSPVAAAPAVVTIHSSNLPTEIIAAGRLLERVWILLNEAGIAVHPYYVVADQLKRLTNGSVPHSLVKTVEFLRDECGLALRNAAPDSLQMILRVGLPTRSPPRSKRLDVARLLSRRNRVEY